MARSSSQRESVQRYRVRMRRAGFRLVQLWVPDTRARGFRAECRRQSLAAAQNKRLENDVMRWIDGGRDIEDWSS